MLVITRKKEDAFTISEGERILATIKVLGIDVMVPSVKLGIAAPREIDVARDNMKTQRGEILRVPGSSH